MDMVLRLVYEKYGVKIPYTDVSACHRFGKYENHTFVLKIWNRKPFSAWDMLSKAMLSSKESSRLNIFVNFMLTARRTELSKKVRQAKKDKYITKYSVPDPRRVTNPQSRHFSRGNTLTWTPPLPFLIGEKLN